jgi:hypothetical protein
MDFHRYHDSWADARRSKFAGSMKDYYAAISQICIASGDPFGSRQTEMEEPWIRAGRPYYQIWPKILPMLARLRLDAVQATQIKLPLQTICFRFSERTDGPLSFDFEGVRYGMKAILACSLPVSVSGKSMPGIVLACDYGETISLKTGYTGPIVSFWNIPLLEGATVEQAMSSMPRHPTANMGIQVPQQVYDDLVRIVCTVCLMGNDPQIIEPDVLAADRDKLDGADQTLMDRLIDKAKRRGKFGFHVGRNLDVSPHYRRAHPALVWTGPARRIPRIVLRKDSLVHRELVEKIPTGHEG